MSCNLVNTINLNACFKKGARNRYLLCLFHFWNNQKQNHFSKANFSTKVCAFEKKLTALLEQPKLDFALNESHTLPESYHEEKAKTKLMKKQNFDFGNKVALNSESLKHKSFNILLVKACSTSQARPSQEERASSPCSPQELPRGGQSKTGKFTPAFNENKSTFMFNSFSNVQCLVTKLGKTHFSKNFVNHFYSNQHLESVKFKKLNGANIEIVNIICTGPQVAQNMMFRGKCVNNRLIKAQCSSLAAYLFLKHMPRNINSFGGGAASSVSISKHVTPTQVLNKSLKLAKTPLNTNQLLDVNVKISKEQHVLETMKIVLGALLINHNKLWFISANELTQCCLIVANNEQNGIMLNAAPVGVTKCLKKSVVNSVAIIKYVLRQLNKLLSQQHLKETNF